LEDLTMCLALSALVFIDWHLIVQALQMDLVVSQSNYTELPGKVTNRRYLYDAHPPA
jgi:hypothetical protein